MDMQSYPVVAAGVDVLVVDDDREVRALLVYAIGPGMGLTVVEAEDGIAALAVIAERHPHLVLTDMCMPNLDGLALVRRLREEMATRDVGIIIVAGSLGARRAAMLAGADDYVDKPFDLEVLLGKVRQQLGRSGEERAKQRAA